MASWCGFQGCGFQAGSLGRILVVLAISCTHMNGFRRRVFRVTAGLLLDLGARPGFAITFYGVGLSFPLK